MHPTYSLQALQRHRGSGKCCPIVASPHRARKQQCHFSQLLAQKRQQAIEPIIRCAQHPCQPPTAGELYIHVPHKHTRHKLRQGVHQGDRVAFVQQALPLGHNVRDIFKGHLDGDLGIRRNIRSGQLGGRKSVPALLHPNLITWNQRN